MTEKMTVWSSEKKCPVSLRQTPICFKADFHKNSNDKISATAS